MKKFLIFDIDHTISTFDHDSGMESLEKHMRARQDKFDAAMAKRICALMDRSYAAFHAKAKGLESPDREKIEALINDAAQEVEGLDNFSDIRWSRELWIYLAGGGSISPATAVEAAGHFWQGLHEAAGLYDDARKFFGWLNAWPDGYNYRKTPEERWKTIFVTSSDARLTASHDNLRLFYTPQHSALMKLSRVQRILPISTFTPTRTIENLKRFVYVGDPVSKPHPEFWQRVISSIGYNPNEDLAIMTGDSPRSDLSGLDKFGIVPILIDRNGDFTPPEVPHAKYIISSLEDLKNIMKIEYLNRKEKVERR